MRTRTPLGIFPLLAIWTAGAADAPITSNPIPEPIVKRGLAVEVKDLARLPDTRNLRPPDQDVAPAAWARVNYVRDLPMAAASPTIREGFCIGSTRTIKRTCTRTSARPFPTRSIRACQAGALRDKFVFGDIQSGRMFASDLAAMKKADDGIPQTVAPIEEIQLYVRDADGKRVDVTFRDLVDAAMGAKMPRADLHISRSRDGELFLTSRQDGMIRMLVPDGGGSGTAPTNR